MNNVVTIVDGNTYIDADAAVNHWLDNLTNIVGVARRPCGCPIYELMSPEMQAQYAVCRSALYPLDDYNKSVHEGTWLDEENSVPLAGDWREFTFLIDRNRNADGAITGREAVRCYINAQAREGFRLEDDLTPETIARLSEALNPPA